MTVPGWRRLTTFAELLEATGGDPFVRCEVPPGPVTGFAADGAVLFLRRPRARRAWVCVLGAPGPAVRLLRDAVPRLDAPVPGWTLPRGSLPLVPPALAPASPGDVDDWDWWCTAAPPPPQPGEERVDWLDGVPDAALRAFLDATSPRYSAVPGAPDVLRWCGVRDTGGALLAVAAHVARGGEVPHLASIAVRGDQRGRGLGGAVTAWVTRELLPAAGLVNLGMYADNAPARAVYRRLGYRDEHRFTSARLGRDPTGPRQRCP